MRRVPLSVALRLAACAGVAWLAWRWNGAVGLVTCAPLFGIALARPILDGIGWSVRRAKQAVYRDVEGRHFVHMGNSMDIVEDSAHHRWLRLTDVRKVIHKLPSDEVLGHLFPDGVRQWESPATTRIEAEALSQYLKKSTDTSSLKFKVWLEREVAFPARRRGERR